MTCYDFAREQLYSELIGIVLYNIKHIQHTQIADEIKETLEQGNEGVIMFETNTNTALCSTGIFAIFSYHSF